MLSLYIISLFSLVYFRIFTLVSSIFTMMCLSVYRFTLILLKVRWASSIYRALSIQFGMVGHYSFDCFLLPSLSLFSLCYSCYLFVCSLNCALHFSEALFIHFIHFFSLFFRMHNFYCSIFKFADFFFCQFKLTVEPSSVIFILFYF